MKVTLLCLFFIYPVLLFSQTKTEKISLEKDDTFTEILYLPNAGLAFATGSMGYYNTKNHNLKFYSASLEKKWDVDVNYEYSTVNSSNSLVASANGDFVYFFNKEELVQIDKNGKMKTKSFRLSELDHISSIFCSSNFLYALTIDEEKNLTGKVALHRFSASNFDYKQVELSSLPKLADEKTTTFWTYAGNSGDTIFIKSKFVDKANRTNKYQIAMINAEGSLIDLVSLDCTVSEFTLPARSYVFLEGGALMTHQNPDRSSPAVSKNVGTHYDAVLESFGTLHIDARNKCIYVYSFIGEELSWVFGKTYDKLNFFKYDFKGNLISKSTTVLEENFPGKDFRSGVPMDGLVVFHANPDGTSFLQMFFQQVYTFEFDQDLKVVSKYATENKNVDFSYSPNPNRLFFDGQITFPENNEDKSYQFINSSTESKPKSGHILYRFYDTDIVLESEYKKGFQALYLLEE